MTTLQEKIANERRRLRSVRQKLTAAVKQKSNGDESFLPFYIAATKYMEVAMERLHAQDIKMGEMIQDKVEVVDDSVRQALGELDERLSGNQVHLEKFLAAGAALREEGMPAVRVVRSDHRSVYRLYYGDHGSSWRHIRSCAATFQCR